MSSKPRVRGRGFIVPKKQVAGKMNCLTWLQMDPQYIAKLRQIPDLLRAEAASKCPVVTEIV